MPAATHAPQKMSGGIQSYYQTKIEAAELLINQKTQNLRRLEAQRNALNARGSVDRPVFQSKSQLIQSDYSEKNFNSYTSQEVMSGKS